MKRRILLCIFASYLLLIGGAFAAANITSYNPTQQTNSIVGETKEFKIDINETVNVSWYIDQQLLKSDRAVKTSILSNSTAQVGQHTVDASVRNATTGTTDTQRWTWTVNAANIIPVEITEYTPTADPITFTGAGQLFSIKTNQNAEIMWYVNKELKQTNTTSKSAIYGASQSASGSYNVTAVASANGTKKTHTWTWRVDQSVSNSGNRIWDANTQMPLDYTWDALSFSGFYYNIDTGEGSEKITVHLNSNSDRSIDKNDLKYESTATTKNFEYKDWGNYQIIGFMAENYFAGYTDNSKFTKSNSLMANGVLSKVLIDDNKKNTFYSGTSLTLQEGYAIKVEQIDLKGNNVYISLTKDGTKIDETIVKNNDNYVYETEIGNSGKIPIISLHLSSIFQGTESSAVFIDGIFQISSNYNQINTGNKYGVMKVKTADNSKISMENEETVALSQGRTTKIMGNLNFIVGDNSILRFAPSVNTSQTVNYEQRGTIALDKPFEWTPLNFEGFYYNINEGIGTEKLSVRETGRTIEKDKLEYTSTPKKVKFKYNDWGEFNVIGFMGEKYFVGYSKNDFTNDLSLVSSGQLAKVLIDDDKKQSLYSGSQLNLEEGYAISIKEVDLKGKSAYLSLSKDGKEVDTQIVPAGKTYTYKKTIGNVEDIPIIVVHFNDIFQGTESSAVFADGVFQISDTVTSVESGKSFGKMTISSLSENGIKMTNKDSLSLSKGKTIPLMGEIEFKIADSDTLRYYPFLKINGSSPKSLKLSHSQIVAQGTTMNITVTANGTSINNAAIKLDGKNIGNTSTNGIAQYVPNTVGNFTLSVEKQGYNSATSKLQIVSAQDESRKMSLEVTPQEVINGSTVQVRVLSAVGGQTIEGVKISFNGTTIGNTSKTGNITYTPMKTGIYKLTAAKDGLVTSEVNVNVKPLAANFVLTNLQIVPLRVEIGEKTNISIDAKNNGTAAGEYKLELKINGTAKDSQVVKLERGASKTITFLHEENESGIYGVNIQGIESTYEVYKESHLMLYSLIALLLIIITGVVYLFTAGGWSIDMLKAKFSEYIGKNR